MSKRGGAHDLWPAAFLRRTGPFARLFESAGAVVAAAGDAAAAATHRVSANAIVVRHRAERGDAVAHAVVAHGATAFRGSARHSRSRWSDLKSANRPGQHHLAPAHSARRR